MAVRARCRAVIDDPTAAPEDRHHMQVRALLCTTCKCMPSSRHPRELRRGRGEAPRPLVLSSRARTSGVLDDPVNARRLRMSESGRAASTLPGYSLALALSLRRLDDSQRSFFLPLRRR
jgi:hypothetical protein